MVTKEGVPATMTKSDKALPLISLSLLFGVAGCSTPAQFVLAKPLDQDRREATQSLLDKSQPSRARRVEMLDGASPMVRPTSGDIVRSEIPLEDITALVGEGNIEVSLPPQALSLFVDTVFGELLKIPYSLGPGVSERADKIALRGVSKTSKSALFAMTQSALSDFGIDLILENGSLRVMDAKTPRSGPPRLVRGRSLPSEYSDAQSVVQFFELQSVDVNSLTVLLSDIYPEVANLKLTARPDINTLVISGDARGVASASAVIEQIDQPRFVNSLLARVEPTYWSSQQLALAVVNTLSTEGYQAVLGAGSIQRAVTFLPIPNTNQLLLFSNVPNAFDRALFWIEQLDQPTALGEQEGVFVYQVQNTIAADIGRLVGAAPSAGSINTGGNTQPPPTVTPTSARITIDPVGNRLLFRGTPSEFARARDLMERLDTPARQVMIEMTIAEVTLTDETRFGIEWEIQREIEGRSTWDGGTKGGLGIGETGLVLNYDHPDVRAALNAFAQNTNVNILSTPRLVARSGGEAEIQVGTDVPIITSQQAAQTQTIGRTDILQTVQYRRTGVILTVKPIVLGDGRIDIELEQEVSSAQSNTTASISSPIILNRNIRTQLSLREGETAVIGGLIQNSYSRSNQGIPLLKDLPVFGSLFRTDNVGADNTELLVLITPHVVDDDEMYNAADNLSRQLNLSLRQRGPHGYTLLPWATTLPQHAPLDISGQAPEGPAISAPPRSSEEEIRPDASDRKSVMSLVPQAPVSSEPSP